SSLPSHETTQPKCLQMGESATMSPSSFLYTQAVLLTSDSYHPSTCSTVHSIRCGSSVISSTAKFTFVYSPDLEGFNTGSIAMRNIGTSIPAANNATTYVIVLFKN